MNNRYNYSKIHFAQWIQQPIPKLWILNFHNFFNQSKELWTNQITINTYFYLVKKYSENSNSGFRNFWWARCVIMSNQYFPNMYWRRSWYKNTTLERISPHCVDISTDVRGSHFNIAFIANGNLTRFWYVLDQLRKLANFNDVRILKA